MGRHLLVDARPRPSGLPPARAIDRRWRAARVIAVRPLARAQRVVDACPDDGDVDVETASISRGEGRVRGGDGYDRVDERAADFSPAARMHVCVRRTRRARTEKTRV